MENKNPVTHVCDLKLEKRIKIILKIITMIIIMIKY